MDLEVGPGRGREGTDAVAGENGRADRLREKMRLQAGRAVVALESKMVTCASKQEIDTMCETVNAGLQLEQEVRIDRVVPEIKQNSRNTKRTRGRPWLGPDCTNLGGRCHRFCGRKRGNRLVSETPGLVEDEVRRELGQQGVATGTTEAVSKTARSG